MMMMMVAMATRISHDCTCGHTTRWRNASSFAQFINGGQLHCVHSLRCALASSRIVRRTRESGRTESYHDCVFVDRAPDERLTTKTVIETRNQTLCQNGCVVETSMYLDQYRIQTHCVLGYV